MFHEVGDQRVHSLSFGTGPGTLVGVAGAFASWEIWAPVFELLSPRWRVVGFDHDGVGQSKAPVERISHERHVETLLSVLDAQGVGRCVVAGDSANAAVAVAAVLREPQRFDGLVIVNGHVWGFDRPEVRRFAESLRTAFEPTLEFFADLVFPEPESDHLKQWLRDIIWRTGPDRAARIIEANFGIDLRPQLGGLDIPTLIIHGALDAVSPSALEDVHELASLIPGAELRLLEDAGHLPLLSRPEVVAELLDDFLGTTIKQATG